MEKYNNELDFRRFIREIKRLRWLYLLAFVVLFGAAIFYYMRSMPQYTAYGELLIEDSSENTPSAGARRSFGDNAVVFYRWIRFIVG